MEEVGCGRACQRPRTSSGAKCFSCEGALAREIAFLNFLQILEIIVAPGGAHLAAEEQGAAKWRGRGRGRRNANEKLIRPIIMVASITAISIIVGVAIVNMGLRIHISPIIRSYLIVETL